MSLKYEPTVQMEAVEGTVRTLERDVCALARAFRRDFRAEITRKSFTFLCPYGIAYGRFKSGLFTKCICAVGGGGGKGADAGERRVRRHQRLPSRSPHLYVPP